MTDENQQQEWLKNTIHFGSLITLSYTDEQGRVFYACCEGFTKSKIRLKMLDEIKYLGQFNSCLFKLYPPFYNSEYLKTKKKFEDRKLCDEVTSIERREARMDLPKQIKATEEECDLNAEQYEKLKGSPVYFGSTVQFLHQQSNKYLKFNSHQVSDFESDNLKADLAAEHGEETYFKFMNCFTFQQETGGYIFDKDTVYIMSTVDSDGTQEPGLHASKTKDYTHEGRIYSKRELNIALEKKSFWKIQIFSKYIDENMGYLSVYDVIWINFSEEDLNLIVQKFSKEKDKKYLKFEGCEITEKYKKFIGNSNGMFVVESEQVTEGGYVQWDKYYRLKHLTTNWQTFDIHQRYLTVDPEHAVIDDEQEIEIFKDSTLPTHSSVKVDVDMAQVNYKLVAVNNIEKASLFKFELIYSTLNSNRKDMALKYLEKDSYFRLCVQVKQQNEYLGINSQQLNQEKEMLDYWLRTKETQPTDEYIIEGQNFIGEISIPLFTQIKKDENVFKLAKANLNQVRETKFLISCMKTIKQSDVYLNIDLANRQQFKEPEFQIKYRRLLVRVKRLENCVYDLHNFCYNKLMNYISFTQEYGEINSFIQNVLREQNFIETLVRILVICFPTVESLQDISKSEISQKSQQGQQVQALMNINENNINSQAKLENQIIFEFLNKKQRVCQLVYRLLQSICDQNQANQELCSKYLSMFAFQSLYIPGAMKCIIQIISNYEELLLNLSKDYLSKKTDITQSKTPMIVNTQPKNAQKKLYKDKQKTSKVGNYDQYVDQYKIFAKSILNYDNEATLKWDLLLFFATMLIKSQSFSKKGEIVKFLQHAAVYQGRGVNINQELGYKYILQEGQIDKVFEQEILIRIKSDGPQIKVYRKGEEQSLIDYFHNHDVIIKQNRDIIQENNNQQEADLVPYICDLLNMYSTMCNSRNYTWKKFSENFFNVESLVENLLNKKFSFELRAIICNMLSKIYVDQEPRRVIIWPELCKVVKTDYHSGKKGDLNITQMSEDYKPNKGELRSDPVEVHKVKAKILNYIEELQTDVDSYCGLIQLSQGFNEKRLGLQQIYKKSSTIYNEHTLEIVKLFRLLINFGKYPIKIGQTNEETKKLNPDLFQNIKCLVGVLEFNTMYPETRKILVEKRKIDLRKQSQLKLDIFSFSSVDEDISKDVKKQGQSSGEDTAEDPSTGESFKKQAQVLGMVMNDFMYGETNVFDVPIKLEICGVLNQYLDFKMDFYLNNLKLKFKEWTDKLGLYQKIENGELDIDKMEHIQIIKDSFQSQINQSLITILPGILKTGVDSVDDNDPNLKAPEASTINFQALANLAGELLGDKAETHSKELEAISINKIIGFNVFPSLVTIFCLNQNLELETQILQVMTRLYNQRYEFVDLSTKLLLIFDEDNIKIFKKSKKLLRLLAKNVDESETWVQNLQNPDHLQTLSTTQGYFQQFTDLMFSKSCFGEKDELYKAPTQDIDPIRQDIIRHLKIDKLGVDFIKDSVFMVSQETDPVCLEKLKGLFRVCFRFLTLYVKDNPINQQALSQNMVALLSNMQTDLGQVELFCELFRNNKKICLDRINDVIDDFARLIIQNGRQTKYLEFFMIVHKVKNEYLSTNQKAVLNIFIDPRFKKDIFYMIAPQQQQINDKKAISYHTFDFQPRVNDLNPDHKDEPYLYHAQLIEVLASCTIGKDGLLHSENKLKALITFRYVMELLLQPDSLTENRETTVEMMEKFEIKKVSKQFSSASSPGTNQISHTQFSQNNLSSQTKLSETYDINGITILKQPLLNFIFYTYLESDKISEDIFKCLPEINLFIKNETTRIMTIVNYNEQFVEYFFSHFMLTLNGLIKIFNRELGAQAHQTGSTMSQQYAVFLSELDILRQVLQTFPMMNLNTRQQTLMNLFLYEKYMHEDQNQESLKEQQKHDQNKQQIKNKEYQEEQKINHEVLNNHRFKKQHTIQMTNRELSTDEIWKELWKIFLKQLLNSEQLQVQINMEQEVFANAIYKSEEIFCKDQSVSEQINKGTIFRRLIAFLEKSGASRDKITTFKLILKALCNYIKIEEIPNSDDLDEKEKEEIRQSQKIDNQNFLNGNNAMQMVLTLLSDYTDPTNSDLIFNDLINFAIQLLDGGNNEIQKSVWGYFQNFTNSEVFFMRVHTKIQDQIMELRKDQLDETNNYLFAFQRDTDQTQNILRLMQLFAEGHYTVLQEYMHIQQKNYRNYDLIQDFIELLNTQMKKLKYDNYDRMMQNFDTLTEFIQGPCYVNQIALLQGNFLELANNLFAVDEITEELKQKQKIQNYNKGGINIFEQSDAIKNKITRPFPRWMYAHLKYKCSVTMISLLEARKDNQIVDRMMKSLNIEVLKRNISDIFYMFQQNYKEEYKPEIFNHQAIIPDSNNEVELNQASFIIETGFNLFIIYSIFLEVKLENDDSKNIKEKVVKLSFIDYIKNGAFGKLFRLVQGIIMSFKDMAVEVQNKAQQALIKTEEIDYQLVEQELKDKRLQQFKLAKTFFFKHTAHIEVLLEDKEIEKTYFYIPPFCLHLDDENKIQFNEEANRISNKSKVTSLQQSSEDIIKVMKLNYQIQLLLNKVKVLAIIVENIQLLRDMEFLLVFHINILKALTINIIIFLYYQKVETTDFSKDGVDVGNPATRTFTNDDDFIYSDLIYQMGVVSIVLSIIIVAYFLARNAPLLIEKAWVGVKKEKFSIFNYTVRTIKTFQYLLTDFFVLYYLMYGAAAVLGTLVHPFFFAFHMFEVMIRFPVLLNVVKSVWQPRKYILYTGLLFVLVMYVFTLFAYIVLSDSYPQGFCESTWSCFLTTFDVVFKYDSGLGAFLTYTYATPGQFSTGMIVLRWVFDNLFNLTLLIILINIVAGIIIDTFGSLREELGIYEYDLANHCFICGFDKETIEKESSNQKGFHYHIKQEHHQWNYIFYIAYIRQKDNTEYTGIESYVADKLNSKEISWFPLNRALCIKKNLNQDDSTEVILKLSTINQINQDLRKQFVHILKELDQFKIE